MRRFFVGILDFIFPKRCVGCGRVGKYFCISCSARIRPILVSETICPICERSAIAGMTHPKCRTRYTPDGLTSFFHYDSAIKKAVKALKYRFVSDIAAEFASLISDNTLSDIPNLQTPILIPIPLHKMRLHQRGFNQAEILGKFVSERLSAQAGLRIPMHTDILLRTRMTKPQVEMKHREERLQNMHGVFSLNPRIKKGMRNKNVILFDDVFTTGATMRAATSILKRAGVKRVWTVTMAR